MDKHFIVISGTVQGISGLPALVELEQKFINYTRTASKEQDVLVFLEPENIPVLEIRRDESNTIFTCESGPAVKKIIIPDGQPFRASIHVRPMKGDSKILTEFLHHACD